MIGYQVGTTDAFGPYLGAQGNISMDGVQITHGDKREHIWIFVAGHQRIPTPQTFGNVICPCTSKFDGTVPAFIGNDYYCDSGTDDAPTAYTLYTQRLWVGEECTPPNYCFPQKVSPGLPHALFLVALWRETKNLQASSACSPVQ